MNIIEARKLAMQGNTVISPSGLEWKADTFENSSNYLAWGTVFGEWREKKEPRKVYGLETNGLITLTRLEKDLIETFVKQRGDRIVEFVEVVP